MKKTFLLTALAVVGLAGSSLGMTAAAMPAAAATAPGPAAVRQVASPLAVTSFNCQNAPQINPSGSSGGLPVYRVTSEGCLSGVHACRALGNDGTTQGVECADILAIPVSGGVVADPVAEAYCQNLSNTSKLPQCANVGIRFDVNVPGGLASTVDSLTCGHSNGNCNNGARDEIAGVDALEVPSACGGSGSASEVWTVELSGGTIELPGSDDTVTAIANLASQHAIVCS